MSGGPPVTHVPRCGTLTWSQREQQSGQETAADVAGEDGGGFRAAEVVESLSDPDEVGGGESQVTAGVDRWWKQSGIGGSGACWRGQAKLD